MSSTHNRYLLLTFDWSARNRDDAYTSLSVWELRSGILKIRSSLGLEVAPGIKGTDQPEVIRYT